MYVWTTTTTRRRPTRSRPIRHCPKGQPLYLAPHNVQIVWKDPIGDHSSELSQNFYSAGFSLRMHHTAADPAATAELITEKAATDTLLLADWRQCGAGPCWWRGCLWQRTTHLSQHHLLPGVPEDVRYVPSLHFKRARWPSQHMDEAWWWGVFLHRLHGDTSNVDLMLYLVASPWRLWPGHYKRGS